MSTTDTADVVVTQLSTEVCQLEHWQHNSPLLTVQVFSCCTLLPHLDLACHQHAI